MTEWRQLDWLPGFDISEDGQIRSPSGRILRARILRGYSQNKLWVGGSLRHVSIHRLVCEAWHGPPFAGAQCAHNDGNPGNNHYSNLRWATPKENQADRFAHGTHTRGAQNPRATTDWGTVREIRSRYTGKPGEIRRLAQEYGLGRSAVRFIVNGSRWNPAHDPDAGITAGVNQVNHVSGFGA